MGIDQCIGVTTCEGLHERIGDTDGKIEVRHLGRRLFQCNEVENVRVVGTEDAHIRAAPGPAMFDEVHREVEEAREGNQPGCHAARRRDSVVMRAHVTKRESRIAA